jgi:membrane protease YdiL (CAAX protease family)
MWLPLGLIGLMVQVTAEEVFFRGYLQTQLVAATKSHVKGMVLAAVFFGLGHVSLSVDGLAAFFPVFWAMLFGLLAGDLTARTGNLGPAIAIHFVNNALAMFLAPVEGQLSGFGLWLQAIDLKGVYTDPLIMTVEVLSLLIMWLIARITLKR